MRPMRLKPQSDAEVHICPREGSLHRRSRDYVSRPVAALTSNAHNDRDQQQFQEPVASVDRAELRRDLLMRRGR